MYSGHSVTDGVTSPVPELPPWKRKVQQHSSCPSQEVIALHREHQTQTTFVPLLLLVSKMMMGADQAAGCAVIQHRSPSLFARCLCCTHRQGGSKSAADQPLTRSTMCAQLYKQLGFAGHLEETCAHASCYFHCQSFSKPAFCFSLFLTAEAFHSLSRSLVAVPVSLGCSLFALLLLDAAVWICLSLVHERSSSTVRPLYLFFAEFILLVPPFEHLHLKCQCTVSNLPLHKRAWLN